jgi:nucleotide-binding universal stress UspA family protein
MSKEKKELIIQQSNEYLGKVGRIFDAKDIPVAVKTSTGSSVANEIVNAAEDEKVDMIAMSTHGRSGISRLAYGSVTYKVLHLETHIPVIVIKALNK